MSERAPLPDQSSTRWGLDVSPDALPGALEAACRVALGNPGALAWDAQEVDGVRHTIVAFLDAVHPKTLSIASSEDYDVPSEQMLRGLLQREDLSRGVLADIEVALADVMRPRGTEAVLRALKLAVGDIDGALPRYAAFDEEEH